MQNTQFKRLFPNEESLTFDGGLDNKFDRALLPNNESPDCANVVFSNGAVTTREGLVKINTNAVGVGANAFDGLFVRRGDDLSETMLAFIDGTMFTLGSTTFITVPSSQSNFTVGQRFGADCAENYIFVGNGTEMPYKWDGTYFTQHGVSAPTATATVASIVTAAGSLTSGSVYQYVYTYVNSALVEGNISPVSTTFTVSGGAGQNTIAGIGTAPASAGVAKRRLYRTKTSAPGAYFKVMDINDNTTTSVVDGLADSSLGAAAPTDNGLPPKYNAIIYFRNILFMNDTQNPNLVWYSNVGTPYTVASTNFFKVGDKASDLVKGFAAFDNNLVVFCEESIWINYMSNPGDPTTWRQLPTNSPYGSKSPYGIANYGVFQSNRVLFPAMQNRTFVGFASLTGMSLDPTNTMLAITNAGSNLESQRIETDMFLVPNTYVPNIYSTVFRNKAYVSITYGASQTTNNRIYVYDFSVSNLKKSQEASWVPFTFSNIGIGPMVVYGGSLYGASSLTNGFVYKLTGTGVYSDDGAAINSYLWTKEFHGYDEDVNLTKDFRYANILIDTAGLYYMNLTYRTDSDSGSGTSIQINLNPGGSLWGSMVWGRDMWGGGSAQIDNRTFLGAIRGKRIQFRFSNQNAAGQKFSVHRLNFFYNIRGYR